MNEKINIIGGAKSGVNLFNYLLNNDIDCNLYYFENEIGESIKKSIKIDQNKLANLLKNGERLFFTSETIFSNFKETLFDSYPTEYFLRDKNNLKLISKKISCKDIENLSIASLSDSQFPVILKPNQSGEKKVPFKFKVIHSQKEMKKYSSVIKHCSIQKYLSKNEYSQCAIAGYFNGSSDSLICVEQINQYPIGVSSYVKLLENDGLQEIKTNIQNFLNEYSYEGFIEFEFKYNKVTQDLYLMDINPRTWGWFYFYLDGIKNTKGVFLKNETPILAVKKYWVNPKRILMSFINFRFKLPPLKELSTSKTCYEPS